VTIQTKTCYYCKEDKPLFDFAANRGTHDRLDHRCLSCQKSRVQEVRQIRKTAPPMSQYCDCCGIENVPIKGHRYQKFCLDHNPEKGIFRGWLCRKCNVAIGLLGDDVAGLQRALAYLQKPDYVPPEPEPTVDLMRFFDDTL